MVEIRFYQDIDKPLWDSYVLNHSEATLYHLCGWKNVIEKTYGHKTYYLMATKNDEHEKSYDTPQDEIYRTPGISCELKGEYVLGILPLAYLKSIFFGKNLISMPFFDIGGVLADSQEIEKELLSEAIKLAARLKISKLELRQIGLLSSLGSYDFKELTKDSQFITHHWVYQRRSHKVRMLLKLPSSSEILIKSFKSKLRSQINKTLKEGLYSKIGGIELLEDFYKVFSINMRDLGSPVHSKKLIRTVLEEFHQESKIVVIYKETQPLACSLIVGFKDVLENPWASALKEYSRLSPNMLLYWTMLEYACNGGYAYFDFGRSSEDEGTYKFKEQWGAEPRRLYWHYFLMNGHPMGEDDSEKSRFNKAIQYWKKLPVFVTKMIGPPIRRHIGL